MRGSNGYLVGEHPVLIVTAAVLILLGFWWYSRYRRR